ncbi:uncharacterized protein LOC130780461 [Actinidia eriantha]|uniref:uncharacterized protein LOC130780461 n=1 Tax=Actinidia eriantha TaxID=165200 RepID=UPI0025881A3F|nr:uncharacterized protein LOC130780461 [Actinidia eriantha]
MSMTKYSWSFYKLQSSVKGLYLYPIFTGKPSQEPYAYGARALMSKFSYGHSMDDGLRLINANTGVSTKATTDMDKNDKDQVQPSLPAPHKPIFPKWAKWLLGSILSLVLPFPSQKWKNFLTFEGKVEEVVEEVENVAEVVEKVAATAENVSAKVADKLPDNGKLKEAALLVEHVSSVIAKDAELTIDFIHKVEELENDLSDLETMVKPVIDKIIAKEHETM